MTPCDASGNDRPSLIGRHPPPGDVHGPTTRDAGLKSGANLSSLGEAAIPDRLCFASIIIPLFLPPDSLLPPSLVH